MGVNMAGNCITDDDAVSCAAKAEIIRRYYGALCKKRQSNTGDDEIHKIELLMQQAEITVENRPVVGAALKKADLTEAPATAMEMPDGTILTGKTSKLLGASSALLLNALKYLANIDDSVMLIEPNIIEPIQDLKVNCLGNHNPRLHTDEVLVALSICAATNENAKKAIDALKLLRGLEAHSTVILSQVDMNVFKKLGINITCEPKYQRKSFYHK
jgi:uncharacterized protein (UPF0371 family)